MEGRQAGEGGGGGEAQGSSPDPCERHDVRSSSPNGSFGGRTVASSPTSPSVSILDPGADADRVAEQHPPSAVLQLQDSGADEELERLTLFHGGFVSEQPATPTRSTS